MDLRKLAGNRQAEWFGLVMISAVLLQIAPVFFLFSVPLMLLGWRQGKHAALAGSAALLVIILLQTGVKSTGIIDRELSRFFIILDIGYPLIFLSGTVAVLVIPGRALYGILAGAGAAAVISIPVILSYSGNARITAFLREQLTLIAEAVRHSALSGGSLEAEVFADMIHPQDFVLMIQNIFLRHYLAGFFILLTLCWLLAHKIGRRLKCRPGIFEIKRFFIPDEYIWPFIFFWLAVIIDRVFGIGTGAFAFWNGGYIFLFLYGIQGISIISFLAERYKLPKKWKPVFWIMIIFVSMVPGLNMLLLIGIPVLGISELWVSYRKEYTA